MFRLIQSILFAVLLLLPAAAGAVSCHCFQDRVFDPERPTAADAYFLATAQNSLIAAAFDIPKRDLVKAKMGGVDADLIWLSYYVADRTGLSVADLFEAWTDGGIAGMITRLKVKKVKLDKPFLEVLSPQATLVELAAGAYRSVMTSDLGIAGALLDRLEVFGANRKEQVLALFVSLLLAEDPVRIVKSVRTGGESWGSVLASTGQAPGQIEVSWRKLIELKARGL